MMEPITAVILMVALMLFLIAMGMPIAFAIALAGSLGIVLLEDWATLLYTVGTFPVSRVATFAWSVIPLFVLMGQFAFISGISTDIYKTVYAWMGRFSGGLAMATVLACAGFAAVCGSSLATGATMGMVAIP